MTENTTLFVRTNVPMDKLRKAGDRQNGHHQQQTESLQSPVHQECIILFAMRRYNIAISAPEISDPN
jgi:hypothetical protein